MSKTLHPTFNEAMRIKNKQNQNKTREGGLFYRLRLSMSTGIFFSIRLYLLFMSLLITCLPDLIIGSIY